MTPSKIAKNLLLCAVACLVAVLPAGSARAAGSGPDVYSDVVPSGGLITCYDEAGTPNTVSVYGAVSFTDRIYYGKDGSVIRRTSSVSVISESVNLDTGSYIKTVSRYNSSIDYVSGVQSSSGTTRVYAADGSLIGTQTIHTRIDTSDAWNLVVGTPFRIDRCALLV